MKKLLILLFLLPVLLLAGNTRAAAYAGSAEDPLISKSFAQTWADTLLSELVEQARILIQSFEAQLNDEEEAPPQKRYALAENSTIRLYEGASITLTEGTAKVNIVSGDFVSHSGTPVHRL